MMKGATKRPSGSGGGGFLRDLEAFEHALYGDMHRAFDLAAGAAAALRRTGGASFRQKTAHLARATSAIRTATEAIIRLAGRSRSAAVRSDGTLDLTAGDNVAGADDHA